MYTLTIPACLIRGAMACQAKKDIRYYLNGILLAANGDVVGTNGSILFKGNAPERVEKDTIIVIDGKIPESAETVSFDFDALTCKTDKNKVFAFSIIDDATYPDYNRVIPTLPRQQHSTGMSLNVSLLSKIEDAFGKYARASLFPGHHSDAMLCTYNGINPEMFDSIFVIMPVRNSVDFAPLFTDETDARIKTEQAKQHAA